ncbi:nuclease-related domain-containing protein [Bacillus alkalicellulosilyticus]|uniref:nuclease-related domain-containing protein n=1 Tax=Alkalihalobacterium alkalicellulosilyticum TaxID=1912214 RepID=UPI000996C5DD|nr:nuclease-related domain-containing protein [Bacillus alkalicellulosilyticus]
MAHLIKLEHYISRYQHDITRYPSQFTRMKKERWYYVKLEWEQDQGNLEQNPELDLHEPDPIEHTGKPPRIMKALTKLKGMIPFSKKEEMDVEEEESLYSFATPRVRTIEEVREDFLNEIYEAQLRWASTSLLEQSRLNPFYKFDPLLRKFTVELPDNYFLMYRPEFVIKQTTVDFDIVLIGPTAIYCIVTLAGFANSIIEGSTERFWVEYGEGNEKKVLSPVIELQRMSMIIQEMLSKAKVEFPIKQIVLCPETIVEYKDSYQPFEIVDKRNYASWLDKMKRQPSPIKGTQMKATKALLQHCHTIAFKRQQIVEQYE